jgi:hypothetical protein
VSDRGLANRFESRECAAHASHPVIDEDQGGGRVHRDDVGNELL